MNEIVSSTRAAGQPIAELEAIAVSGREAIFIAVPPHLANDLVTRFGAPSPDLFHGVTSASVAGLLEAVRTRVLNWALGLDSNGVHGENLTFSADEAARRATRDHQYERSD